MLRFLGGRKRPKSDWPVISTVLDAQSQLGRDGRLSPGRLGGLVFRPADIPVLNGLDSELRDTLYHGEGATRTAFRIEDDPHGTRWVVLEDGDFRDLVSSAYTVGNMLSAKGAAGQLLGVVFSVRLTHEPADFGERRSPSRAYWIYTYRRKAYYPFVPVGEGERDRPLELRLAAEMRGAGIAVDRSLEDWYGLWGIPF